MDLPPNERTASSGVTADVECLTEAGWVSCLDLNVGDRILAYDQVTGTTRWDVTSGLLTELYDGPMVRFCGRSIDVLSTPDHRWPVEVPVAVDRTQRAEWRRRIYTSATMPGDVGGYLILGADHEAPTEPTYPDALAALVGWIMTEGSLYPGHHRISLTQSKSVNSANVAVIRGLLSDLGAQLVASTAWNTTDATTHHRGPGGRRQRRVGLWVSEQLRNSEHAPDHECVIWNIHGTAVDDILACFDEHKAPRPQFLLALTQLQLETFVWACLLGDGSAARQASRPNVFWQHDQCRMDAFAMAATLAGYAVSASSDGHSCTVRGLDGRGRRKELRKLHRQTEHYCGVVWCPTVPSGCWLARREGRTFVTGNAHALRVGASGSGVSAV